MRNEIKHIFDFDLGHLKSSPCKTCHRRPLLPDCADACPALDLIQTTLARGISTTHTHSAFEPFTVCMNPLLNKPRL